MFLLEIKATTTCAREELNNYFLNTIEALVTNLFCSTHGFYVEHFYLEQKFPQKEGN